MQSSDTVIPQTFCTIRLSCYILQAFGIMMLTFRNRIALRRQGASVLWHHTCTLPLINSFNKTAAAISPWSLCFLMTFPFSQINLDMGGLSKVNLTNIPVNQMAMTRVFERALLSVQRFKTKLNKGKQNKPYSTGRCLFCLTSRLLL